MTISSLKSFLLTPAKKDFHTAISTVAATTIEIVPGQRRTKDLNHHCHHRHLHATRRFFSSGNIDDHNNNDLCDPKSPIAHKSKLKLNYFRGWAYQQVYLNRRINHKRQQQSPGDSDHTVRNRTESVTSDDDSNNGHDRDRILFFEHDPVYTLGRGADENHLTFLDEKNRHLLSRRRPSQRPHSNSGANEGAVGDREQRQRQGQNSRLYVDKFKNNQNCYGLSVEEEVDSIDEPQPILSPNGAPIYRIERGGEVTYHGPGQLVCYPLLDLTQNPPYKQDLHWYLHSIEEMIIQTLSEYDIQGKRDDINTGVWVDNSRNGGNANKIAAVGVSSSRWITTHGFALNIDPDLSYFDTSFIIPCGIEGRGVTSLANVLRERNDYHIQIPSIDDVTNVVIDKFEHVFDVKVERGGSLLS